MLTTLSHIACVNVVHVSQIIAEVVKQCDTSVILPLQADNVKAMSQQVQGTLQRFWMAQRLHQLGQILTKSYFTLTVCFRMHLPDGRSHKLRVYIACAELMLLLWLPLFAVL